MLRTIANESINRKQLNLKISSIIVKDEWIFDISNYSSKFDLYNKKGEDVSWICYDWTSQLPKGNSNEIDKEKSSILW